MSPHDQVEAMTLATRICVLRDGAVQQIGTPEDIYYHPANTYVANFMGSPPMNLLTAHKNDAQTISLAGETTCSLDLNSEIPDQFLLGIRPEDVNIVAADAGQLSGPLTVETVEKTGSDTFVTTTLNNDKFIIRAAARSRIKENDMFNITFNKEAVTIFDQQSEQRIPF